MKKLLASSALFLALPLVALAQGVITPTGAPLSNIQRLVQTAGNIVGMLIPILIAIALIVFFWGLIKYIRTSGEGHKEGKNIMIAGLVSLFIMVCVWGIVIFAADALGVRVGGSAPAPGIPGYNGAGYTGGYNPVTGNCINPNAYAPGC